MRTAAQEHIAVARAAARSPVWVPAAVFTDADGIVALTAGGDDVRVVADIAHSFEGAPRWRPRCDMWSVGLHAARTSNQEADQLLAAVNDGIHQDRRAAQSKKTELAFCSAVRHVLDLGGVEPSNAVLQCLSVAFEAGELVRGDVLQRAGAFPLYCDDEAARTVFRERIAKRPVRSEPSDGLLIAAAIAVVFLAGRVNVNHQLDDCARAAARKAQLPCRLIFC